MSENTNSPLLTVSWTDFRYPYVQSFYLPNLPNMQLLVSWFLRSHSNFTWLFRAFHWTVHVHYIARAYHHRFQGSLAHVSHANYVTMMSCDCIHLFSLLRKHVVRWFRSIRFESRTVGLLCHFSHRWEISHCRIRHVIYAHLLGTQWWYSSDLGESLIENS